MNSIKSEKPNYTYEESSSKNGHQRYKLMKKRNREYVDDYLKKHPCIDCGNDNIIMLEFDHVRGIKEHNIATMVENRSSIATIQAEIDKCEVRCANCHRLITHNRRKVH